MSRFLNFWVLDLAFLGTLPRKKVKSFKCIFFIKMHILLECVCFSAQANEKNAFFASHFFYKCIVYSECVRISDIVIINLILYFRNWGGWFNLHMETYRTWQVVLGPPPPTVFVCHKSINFGLSGLSAFMSDILYAVACRGFLPGGGKIWNCARNARYCFPLPPWGGGTSTAKQKLLRKFKLFSLCKW